MRTHPSPPWCTQPPRAMVAHHKTGTVFVWIASGTMQHMLQPHCGNLSCSGPIRECQDASRLIHPAWEDHRIAMLGLERSDSRTRFVQLVRNRLEQTVSGYLYHRAGSGERSIPLTLSQRGLLPF